MQLVADEGGFDFAVEQDLHHVLAGGRGLGRWPDRDIRRGPRR
jgi:hypothetical protein